MLSHDEKSEAPAIKAVVARLPVSLEKNLGVMSYSVFIGWAQGPSGPCVLISREGRNAPGHLAQVICQKCDEGEGRRREEKPVSNQRIMLFTRTTQSSTCTETLK